MWAAIPRDVIEVFKSNLTTGCVFFSDPQNGISVHSAAESKETNLIDRR